MAYEFTEQQKAGLGLIGFGIVFTFLGVVLFFDRGLLALGNVKLFPYFIIVVFVIGFCIFSSWALFHLRSMASCWYIFGDIWLHCALWWFLVICESISLSNPGDWLVNTVPILILDRLQRGSG